MPRTFANGPGRPRERSIPAVQIRKQFHFEAAHVLPKHPGKCNRVHGHSYRFEVAIEGPLQPSGPASGMVMDFDEIEEIVKAAVVERLDHTSLNDMMPNPTAEQIAIWIFNQLASELDGLQEVVVWETPTASAIVGTGDAELSG
jgi:6-pyruvoyltetrahydropterin/6-carboxytetrahydropterin synthase